jgi:hypothetical protein
MTTETIELEVDPETARRYREAGPEERKRIAQGVSERLGDEAEARARLLESIQRVRADAKRRNPVAARELDDILGEAPTSAEVARVAGDMARANGLTPAILESLLHE